MSDSPENQINSSPKGATTETETNEILAAIEALVVTPKSEPSVAVVEVAVEPLVDVAKPVAKKPMIAELPAIAVVAEERIERETPAVETEVAEVEEEVEAAQEEVTEPLSIEKEPVAKEQPVIEEPVIEETVAKVETAANEVPVAKEEPVAKEQPVIKEPTQKDSKHVEDPATVAQSKNDDGVSFADLPLSEAVQAAVLKTGYERPTPIQAEIIPHMLEGRDILAQSQTGTGKTAAFALPILSRIDVNHRRPQVLVLTPTRELAIQVAKSFETYAANLPKLNVATIYGGQGYEPQFRALRNGAQVVVGTPGRVIDHLKRESLQLDSLKCLVLDEADEMLNMGFLEDVELVLEHTPETRQIALFSATLPEPIRQISKRYLNDPARVTIKKKTMTADSIRQRAVIVSPRDKFHVLTRFIEAEATDGVIVFTKTKDATVTVADQLTREGFSAIALNGDMPQNVRERAIQQIKSGRFDILVATDVAARGLDVTRVSHVFNYDLPHDSESYIHRIGRTGRAGRKGEALIFLTGSQRYKLKHIERVTRQVIEVVSPPPVEIVNEKRIERFKGKLTEVIDGSDLATFEKIVCEYHAETGKSMESIASALAFLAQGGRKLLLSERMLQSTDPRERHDTSKKSKSGKKQRVLGPAEEGMIRYRIAVGWRDGVKPGNIVGCIANEAGLEGKNIGPISIQHSYSTVDLPAEMPKDVFHALKTAWVSGKQLRLSADGEGGWDDSESDRDSRPRKRFDKNRKPGSNGSTGGKRFSRSSKPAAARSSDQSGSKSGKPKRANTSNFGKSSFGKSSKSNATKGGKGKFRKAKA